jgi:nitronate monooxygenase
MLKNRLTALLGIRYPIISAPMALASGGGLATAVSSAGGLGTFGAANPWGAIGTDYVQIRHIRSHTDRPFSVGFITQAIQRAPKNFDVVLDEAVDVIIFSFADPGPWLIRAKQAGQ